MVSRTSFTSCPAHRIRPSQHKKEVLQKTKPRTSDRRKRSTEELMDAIPPHWPYDAQTRTYKVTEAHRVLETSSVGASTSGTPTLDPFLAAALQTSSHDAEGEAYSSTSNHLNVPTLNTHNRIPSFYQEHLLQSPSLPFPDGRLAPPTGSRPRSHSSPSRPYEGAEQRHRMNQCSTGCTCTPQIECV